VNEEKERRQNLMLECGKREKVKLNVYVERKR